MKHVRAGSLRAKAAMLAGAALALAGLLPAPAEAQSRAERRVFRCNYLAAERGYEGQARKALVRKCLARSGNSKRGP